MSMRHKKFIERNERYDIVQWKFKGIPITFRFWKNGSQIAEIKVDENFAKAIGGVPEWIRTDAEGNFMFVGMNPILFN